VTLVVESFERLASQPVPAELAQLVEDCPQLQLITVGRSSLGIERRLAAPGAVRVVDPAALRFSFAEVMEVLGDIGRPLSAEETHLVERRLGGWPAAVARLARILRDTPPDKRSVTAAIDSARSGIGDDLLTQLEADGLLAATAPFSVVEQVTPSLAQLLRREEIVDDPTQSVLSALARLEWGGLLVRSSHRDTAEETWRWLPIARAIVHDRYVMSRPRHADLEVDLARWYATRSVPDKALAQAVQRGAWQTALDIIEEYLLHLLFDHLELLIPALSSIPEEALSGSILVRSARDLVLRVPLGDTEAPAPELLDDASLSALGHSPYVRRTVNTYLSVIAMFRYRGMLDKAAVYDDQLAAIVRAAKHARTPHISGMLAFIGIQSALVHELLGDNHGSISRLRDAYRVAAVSEFGFTTANAAGKLAMAYAIGGEIRQATTWAAREEAAPAPTGWTKQAVSTAGLVARALIGVATLDQAACATALARLRDIAPSNELLAFELHARAMRELLWGDRHGMLNSLDAVRAERDSWSAAQLRHGVAAPLLAADEANLLMALGNGNRAASVLAETTRTHPALDVARSRLALLAGDNERALHLAHVASTTSATAADPTPGPDMMTSAQEHLEFLCIQGLAHQRLGHVELARDAIARALQRSRTLGTWLPLAELPRSELLAVIESLPRAHDAPELRLLAEAPELFTNKLALVTLTDREHRVLEALTQYANNRQDSATGLVSQARRQLSGGGASGCRSPPYRAWRSPRVRRAAVAGFPRGSRMSPPTAVGVNTTVGDTRLEQRVKSGRLGGEVLLRHRAPSIPS
jgi:LuxR family maltose regulon positive regulatory protein